MKTKTLMVGLLLVASAALAGCVGGDDGGDAAEPASFEAQSHKEESEKTVATVTAVEGDLQYDDMHILVNGKTYRFGQYADHADRRYQVNGRADANEPVEHGDKITIPAVGLSKVEFVHKDTGAVFYSYEAVVPDNTAPHAPTNLEPKDGAKGVSPTPTFRWDGVDDPSGVTYVLEYSLDPTFSVPLQTVTREHVSVANYVVSGGNELQPGQTYYWHVRAVDGSGNAGPWSVTWSFTVANAD